MVKIKNILKGKKVIAGALAALLASSCLVFDFEQKATNPYYFEESSVVPQNDNTPVENYETPGAVQAFSYNAGDNSDISLVEGTTTTINTGSQYGGERTVTCNSSDPSVATVNEQGVVTAYKAGTARLTYSVTAIERKKESYYLETITTVYYTHNVNITVTSAAIEVTSINVTKTSYELTKGSTATLSYSVQPANATDKNVTWTSSNTSVATVNGYAISAVGAGTTTITGRTNNGVTATVYVTVTALPESIRVSSNEMTLKKGESSYLTYTIAPAGVTDNVTWSSSNTSIATINANGMVTAKKSGTAVITAKTSNGYSDTCAVTIISEVESIQFTENNIALDIGNEKQLELIITPSDVPDANVTLTVSDPSIVSLNSNGKIKALKAGTATITARTDNGKTATCKVTVNKAVPEKITVSPSSKTAYVGDSLTLTTQITPAEAANDNLTWSSNQTSIATVDVNGKVTAKAAGAATITVKTSNGKTATCTITVKDVEATGVTVSSTAVTLEVDKTQAITAKVSPDKADQSVTWTSSNTSVAAVSSNGTITAKAVGTATITAKTTNGKTAAVAVTVKAVEATSVAITASVNSCLVNSTIALAAKVSPDKASQSVTWTSSNTSVATVSSSGVVTAKAVGTTTITAKTANSKSATYTITVNPVTATAITLSETSKELAQDATVTLRATIVPANVTDKAITWTSSNSSVATVDTNGKVTAKAAGTATITVKTANSKTATCTITVTETAVESITFDKTTAQMNVDETMTLTATVDPSNAGNKTLTWFSNNESVLTVDTNGKVTAKGAGKAIITAKSANGKIATSVITVVDPNSCEVVFPSNVKDIGVGTTETLEYDPLPNGVKPEFVSMNESIVTVDSNGKVTGVKVGSAVVKARAGTGKWSMVVVYVLPAQSEIEAARQKFAEDVLYYVNIEREKEGLAPLQLMDDLSYVAQIRTDEQAAVRTISHTRPDGTKWSTVFGESPNPIQKKAWGENLVQSAGYTAEGCVKAWMASKGHRENILRSNFTHMGIGVEFTNSTYQGSYIVTQIFIQQ